MWTKLLIDFFSSVPKYFDGDTNNGHFVLKTIILSHVNSLKPFKLTVPVKQIFIKKFNLSVIV